MKNKLGLLWLLIIFTSSASAQWTNEPAGSQVRVDCNMNDHLCTGSVSGGTFYDLYNNLPLISDPSEPISPGSVRVAALPYSGPCIGQGPLPCAVGGGQLGWYNNAPTTDLYIGASFKINDSYSCSGAGSSKFFFMRAFENTFGFPGSNGVFLVQGCDEQKQIQWMTNGGVNNSHICGGDSNGLLCYPNMSAGKITRGQWIKFEACVRGSTTPTSRDGVVRWWINGVEAGHYDNYNSNSPVINEWAWNQTWDGYGNGQAFTSDASQSVGHIRISVPANGGCRTAGNGGGGSTPQPTPTPVAPSLNKPANLRFI